MNALAAGRLAHGPEQRHERGIVAEGREAGLEVRAHEEKTVEDVALLTRSTEQEHGFLALSELGRDARTPECGAPARARVIETDRQPIHPVRHSGITTLRGERSKKPDVVIRPWMSARQGRDDRQR
jgi:hypothetical protein